MPGAGPSVRVVLRENTGVRRRRPYIEGVSIPEIVLTGGPCAGKSSAMAYLSERLTDWGMKPFVVPEAATLLAQAGLGSPGALAGDQQRFMAIQREFIMFQRDLRARFRSLAGCFPSQRPVIIYDRGEMDAQAYIGREYCEALLADLGLGLAEARDSYDAVIHLVSAADGAEEHYTLSNNAARSESPELARELDRRNIAAWTGHPHLVVIDNSTDFAGKLHRTAQALARVLGIPVPLEIERKYLLAAPPDLNAADLQDAVSVEITQAYLASDDDTEVRVRRRSQDGHSTFYRTEKRSVPDSEGGMVRQEKEERISHLEYTHLLRHRDPAIPVVRKRRTCFVYASQYFELDSFELPSGLCVLEIELTEEQSEVSLPPFLEIEREVTDDPDYRTRALAAASS